MAEVDFVIQKEGEVVPIEVKAFTNLQAKSLASYRQQYQPAKAIRTSLALWEVNHGLANIPLYLMENFSAFWA